MAKKNKKNDPRDLNSVVDKLIGEVGDDRDRLVKFLDALIQEYDGEKAVGIAEYVAKLMDALTRQHHIKATVVKALAKTTTDDTSDSDLEDLHREIGLPFGTEGVDDGSN